MKELLYNRNCWGFIHRFFYAKVDIFKDNRKRIKLFLELPGFINNNKPDFLFPNAECYHNFQFPAEDLTMLGAKTTCKDRWRQVINEADRIWTKHLFTLQPGISKNQLKEMADNQVKLVVPQKNISTFPAEYQLSLSDLSSFIQMVRKKQESLPKYYILA